MIIRKSSLDEENYDQLAFLSQRHSKSHDS